MQTNKSRIKLAGILFVASMAALLFSCDLMENDVRPEDAQPKIEGATVYTTSTSSAFIDLHRLVKTQNPVQFKITSQPKNGRLTELGKGIVEYSPNDRNTTGKDRFGFSISTLDNKLLTSDSITIIISDSTHLPCGIYAQKDLVTDSLRGPVTIDVLQNDTVCDSLEVKVDIFQTDSVSLPEYGTATVISGNRIVYSPGAHFNGKDHFYYKVYSIADSTFSIGEVLIEQEKAINVFILNDDHYAFDADTLFNNPLPGDTLKLEVFANDDLLTGSSIPGRSTISLPPSYGRATVYGLSYIRYAPSGKKQVTDTLRYQVCYGAQCKTAKVTIQIK